ncbi:Cation/acetate symporter ActP [Tepidimonas sediminis]|uniref:Cation/acetate symporter ActP n=1 Tax=Tepidimonas sediminis TaxID=2588941 RepID=A0A554WUK4_9BURK|nr:sodium:solute symporter family protein [Tepidimonas sediminis]TSE27251.1 Cation/acetate symporter ActP [Tepidimonas sediminis]
MRTNADDAAYRRQLVRLYARFTLAFLAFTLLLAALERLGWSRTLIGVVFLLATLAVYATIGILTRTVDPVEYYVAGRRVPAPFNGMALAADWLSAASFIGLAGTLYLQGYGGLAFVLGWSGGFVLVAVFLAPYLRRFGQFTIPDFLAERYGGAVPRLIGVVALVLCSFIYVVAQIVGVGLITSRLTGLAFEVGVFLGLGGILVCSFLGGMRAITWTQVAQYIVLIVAFVAPVLWLSLKQTGSLLPQLGYVAQLQQVSAREQALREAADERHVQRVWAHHAHVLAERLRDPAAALQRERAQLEGHLEALRLLGAEAGEIAAAERALARLPRDAEAARMLWSQQLAQAQARAQPLGGLPPHAQPFAGAPDGEPAQRAAFEVSRRNFLALVFCLVVGTAALPHLLVRFYTVPSVAQARQSVAWGIVFIAALYLTAPALAVLVKHEVFTQLVGTRFDELPAWVAAWSKVDPALLSVRDVNRDGVLQLGEITLGADVIVLAAAEIAGLPYVIAALVAAGGMAAALSTADGLLLAITSALSHDVYYKTLAPAALTARRVTLSKVVLLVVALLAAYVAAHKPADILLLVAAAFSLAASAFFPALVLGIFWSRANGPGAVAGMLVGMGVTLGYVALNQPWLRGLLGLEGGPWLWWGIEPIAAGVFGVPAGAAALVVVSLLTPAPSAARRAWVRRLRMPGGPEL